MPLYDAMTGKELKTTPYPETFALLDRMSSEERAAAEAALEAKIEGSEIETSSWMPGADWEGTPYQAIYEKAARKNFDLAAKLFGLMVFDVFRRRPETWQTGRFEKDGEPLRGRTYFRSRS